MTTIVPVKVHNELVLSFKNEWRVEASRLRKLNKASLILILIMFMPFV
jgi:hypothetical protein